MQSVLQKIIQQIKKGDKAAFRQLVEHYQQAAFNLAFRMLGDDDEARDVVQDSFIRIWEKIDTYNSKEKFTNWMYKIVSNRAIDRLRAIKRRPFISIEKLIPDSMSTGENSSDIYLENKEIGELIRVITDGLPQKQQLIFTLRDLQGLSTQEVKEITGLLESSIKSNLYHARKTIREKLLAILTFERQ